MHLELQKLYEIGKKETRKIIGLMSGTSLDGLDIALCDITGSGHETALTLKHFHTEPYDVNYRENVQAVFSKHQVDLQHLCVLNPWIAEKHGAMILSALEKWGISPNDIDVIASHGQTIYHCPKILHQRPEFSNATLQLGDGDHLAKMTGIITLSDFRQKHIAAGGEGAPLAAYGDNLIFSDKHQARIMLNIGGIANMTYLPEEGADEECFCTDIGPGNTMMDAYVRQHFSPLIYDDGSKIARSGSVSEALLTELKDNEFFDLPFPKTTGPELFNLEYLHKALECSNTADLSHTDIMATLSKFSADGIIHSVKNITESNKDIVIYTSGGGIHNPLLLENIKAGLPEFKLESTHALDVDPDAKEAVLFALLANECISGVGDGDGLSFLGMPKTTMGKISFSC